MGRIGKHVAATVIALPSAEDWAQEVLLGQGETRAASAKRARNQMLRETRQAYLQRGIPNNVTMDLLFCGEVKSTRATKDGVRLRQWNDVVACWTLCRVDETTLVCAPEFLFQQICAEVRTIVPEHGVVVEYDSNEIHQGQERRDADRRELLQDMV
ncbi:MAG: hypothetical protein Q4A07_10655 [Coriobacteriales bacterium]|nr:hypothetical protein [Coriobacteriales bacterium]